MIRVEFHCHTIYSPDSLTSPHEIVSTCRRKGIDRIVITDHNTIEGALRAQELDPQRVIVGEEIMTRSGELLTAFVTEQVPAGLPAQEAIQRLRQQGAFISVSHPFDALRKGHWDPPDLQAIADQVDAIETFNARCIRPGDNRKAQAFAAAHGLPGTVGSDAHAPLEIGAATLLMSDFSDPASLRAALPEAQMRGALSPFWVHFFSRYAKWRKKYSSSHRNK